MSGFQTIEFILSRFGNQYEQAGSIRLISRNTVLGDSLFRQFWIPKTGLFGTRNKLSSNHSAVLDFYRCLCIDRLNDQLETPAKVHLLASLLPLIRSNGAQGIFPDASVVTPKNCPTQSEFSAETLEFQLKASEAEQISVADFCNRNREALEFPDFPDSTFKLYWEFESELLGNPTSRWWENPTAAYELVEKRWLQWRDGFGRRRGNKEKKDVLNILSFECKAAFHQVYSALWVEMIPNLIEDQDNQLFSQRFHALWHLDHRISIPGHDRDVHLLHGLALGLHPALGTMLKTETGSRLVGEAVAAPEDTDAQERFLHASLVSLYLYAAARRSRTSQGNDVSNFFLKG